MDSRLTEFLEKITNRRIIPAISLAVGKSGKIVFSGSFGHVYETGERVTNKSRFDIASMTKIFSGICFMQQVEQGRIGLNDPICNLFPQFAVKKEIERDGKIIGYCDAGKLTWFQAFTHTTGMGWTRPKTRPSLPNLDKDLQDIFTMPFAYTPGTHVVYSDIPIILMGIAMEQITGKRLDEIVLESVCKPLNLSNSGYRRFSRFLGSHVGTVPTENDMVFRKRRIWGEVHDENAFLLDGVAAHAGVFSTSEDICRLMMEYSLCLDRDGLLKRKTAMEMIRPQAEEDGERRGLMWQLSGRGEQAYTRFLSPKAYGHAGFTGCFGWNDPQRDLTVVCLSNDVYNGRERRKLFEYRAEIMQMVVELF